MGISRRTSDVVAEEEDSVGTDVDVDLDADADGDLVLLARGELAATAAGRLDAAQTANSSSGCSSWLSADTDDAASGSVVEVVEPAVVGGASMLPLSKPDRMGWKSGRIPAKLSRLSDTEVVKPSASVPNAGTAVVGSGAGADAGVDAAAVAEVADAPAPSLVGGSWRICCSRASLCFRFSPIAGVSNTPYHTQSCTKMEKGNTYGNSARQCGSAPCGGRCWRH